MQYRFIAAALSTASLFVGTYAAEDAQKVIKDDATAASSAAPSSTSSAAPELSTFKVSKQLVISLAFCIRSCICTMPLSELCL